MGKWVTIVVLLTGCPPKPSVTTTPIEITEPLYCFSGMIEMPDGEIVPMRGCTPSLKLCNYAFRTALKYGRFAKVKRVNQCAPFRE